MVAAAVAQTGENITVSRFARFKLGEAVGVARPVHEGRRTPNGRR